MRSATISSSSPIAYVLPIAEPGVHFSVIDGIEARVSSVNWGEEGKQMHTTKEPGKRASSSLSCWRSRQAINVSDELDLIFQDWPLA